MTSRLEGMCQLQRGGLFFRFRGGGTTVPIYSLQGEYITFIQLAEPTWELADIERAITEYLKIIGHPDNA